MGECTNVSYCHRGNSKLCLFSRTRRGQARTQWRMLEKSRTLASITPGATRGNLRGGTSQIGAGRMRATWGPPLAWIWGTCRSSTGYAHTFWCTIVRLIVIALFCLSFQRPWWRKAKRTLGKVWLETTSMTLSIMMAIVSVLLFVRALFHALTHMDEEWGEMRRQEKRVEVH